MDISVVIPVYGCPTALRPLCERLTSVLEGMGKTFEILLVDDHDPQNSWEEIESICKDDERVIGIKLSRNFGQIRAITAGLDESCGEWVVVMDCDLQDRPEAIPALYETAIGGDYDVVFARRAKRKDNVVTKFLSRSFYKVYGYFTEGNYDASLCNFSISRRAVIEAYCSMREHQRAYTMYLKWVGFRQTAIDVEGDSRFEGKSSYNLSKKLSMATELITAQSVKPLRFAMNMGFVIAFLSFVFLVVTVIRYFFFGPISIGYTSTIASIYLVCGLLLAAIGIVGLYVGNIFIEVKKRPLYIIQKKINDRDEQ